LSFDDYIIKLESPSVEEFTLLRGKIGWDDIDVNLAETSLKNSLFHVTVYDKSELVAMGRVVGDGAMYFYIQDVIVDPNYQKMGVGSVVMKHIEAYLAVSAAKGSTIGLLAAKGKEAFYRKYGYIKRPNESLGNGMCRFV
jgi:ribosomal protein S18 acetylase RimI-like enzyme